MYPGALNAAGKIDFVFLLLFGFSVLVLAGITAAMIYFVYKYSRKRHPVPSDKADNMLLEATWIVIPTIIVLVMFWYGWSGFKALREVPEGAMTVKVEGYSFGWQFEYENGKKSKELVVPAGVPVKVEITSRDVLHSFFIPAYRIKIDAVPGQSTYVTFTADKEGEYDIFCTEYCGVGHSKMLSKVVAVPQEKFDAFLAEQAPSGGNAAALALFDKHGCTGCHSFDGSAAAGPTLKDIFGRKAIVTAGGKEKEVTSDEAYLKEAILNPEASIVKGFEPIMPPYAGQIPDAELQQMLEYLKGGGAPAALDGKAIAENAGCIGCHSTDGSVVAGPSLKGIAGRQVEVVTGGKARKITSDREYLKRSIVQPEADIVKGFDPIMPPFDQFKPEELEAVITYMESLK